MAPEPGRRAALVVAHPDDEVVFLGALAARLRVQRWNLDIICVTGDFGSAFRTGTRRAEFGRAAWALGARAQRLRLADQPGPLDEAALTRAFAEEVHWSRYARIYTHGVWGEYGHLHHVQVCRATHRHGAQVYALAGPFVPEIPIVVTAQELDRKRELAGGCYPSQPFAAAWCSDSEHLIRLSREAADYLTAIAWTVATGGAPAPWAPPHPPADLPALASGAARGPAEAAHIPTAIWHDGHRARLDLLRRQLGSADRRSAHPNEAGQNGAGSPLTDFSK